MKSNFFIHYSYKEFSIYEDSLMSLIVGLNKSKQRICFSNGYAALILKCSSRKISQAISKFVSDGYIEITLTSQGRIIRLINEPEKFNYKEECEITLEGVEYGSTQGGTTFHPPTNEVLPPTHHILPPHAPGSTNNIVDNIDDSIAAVWQPSAYPSDFLSLVERYKEEGVNMEKAFQVWNRLDAVQRKLAFDNVEKYLLYLESDRNTKGYYKKELAYYLQDGIYSWGAIKNFRAQPKKLSKEEQNKLALEQLNKFLQK